MTPTLRPRLKAIRDYAADGAGPPAHRLSEVAKLLTELLGPDAPPAPACRRCGRVLRRLPDGHWLCPGDCRP